METSINDKKKSLLFHAIVSSLAFACVIIVISFALLTYINHIRLESAKRDFLYDLSSGIKNDIDLFLSKINTCSKLIILDYSVQNFLNNEEASFGSAEFFTVKHNVSIIASLFDNIDFVYLINFKGQLFKFFSTENLIPGIHEVDISDRWVGDVMQEKGRPVYFDFFSVFTDVAHISPIPVMARTVYDINKQVPIGILLIGFRFLHYIDDSKIAYDIDLLSENGESFLYGKSLLFSHDADTRADKIIKTSDRIADGILVDIDNTPWSLLVKYIDKGKNNPGEKVNIFFLIGLLFVVVLLWLFFQWIWFIRNVSMPLKNILTGMRLVEKGIFKPVENISRIYEFFILENRYNDMRTKLHLLIEEIKNKEKDIRNAELFALQSQIKPHFLYNTFDSISYFILQGEKEKANNILLSLGRYYRSVLEENTEIINLSDELKIVRYYVEILGVRYNNLFRYKEKIDNNLLSFNLPRLSLQPLVENAFYHGVKPSMIRGVIELEVSQHKEHIYIKIKNTGRGIPEDKLQQLKSESQSLGFGFWGTIKRFRYLWGDNFSWNIKSNKHGTILILSVRSNDVRSNDS